MGFEHRRHRLLSRREFAARWGKWAAGAIGLMMASWAVGALGYRLTEGWGWIDDFHAAALILGAMGPAHAVQTDASGAALMRDGFPARTRRGVIVCFRGSRSAPYSPSG